MAFHLEKKHWIWMGAAAAGVAGLYLLTHRSGGGTTASADSGLPATGPPQLGNMTPSASLSSPDAGNQVASFLSSRDRYMQQAQARAAESIAPTGIVSKAWKQLTTGDWEDRFHPGHIISEQQAESIASSNSGPYARGGGGFFGQVGNFLGGLLKTVASGTAATYGAGQPITLGSAFLGPKRPAPPAGYPPFTPGIAPSPPRAPAFGNPAGGVTYGAPDHE